jgi:hypothetical protein
MGETVQGGSRPNRRISILALALRWPQKFICEINGLCLAHLGLRRLEVCLTAGAAILKS